MTRMKAMLAGVRLGLVGMCTFFACHNQESQAAEAVKPAKPVASVAAASSSGVEGTSASAADPVAEPSAPVFHEQTFDVELHAVGKYETGKPGVAEIQLHAKAGYHCNDKYPYKFKLAETPGLKFASPIVMKDAVQLENENARMKLEFTPESKGEKVIAGVFSFSLCSAERCLVEKRDLSLKIDVD